MQDCPFLGASRGAKAIKLDKRLREASSELDRGWGNDVLDVCNAHASTADGPIVRVASAHARESTGSP